MATHSFVLDCHRAVQPLLVFRWDPDTGEITGPHAELVRVWLEAAKRGGVIAVDSGAMRVIDPFHSALEFAAVLAQFGYDPLPEPFGSALHEYRTKTRPRAGEGLHASV